MNIPRFDGGDTKSNHIENKFFEKRKIYINIQKILAAVLYLCLLLALETTWLSGMYLPFLGEAGRGSPALGWIFAVAVAFLLGERDGCIAGCITGFMYECLTGAGYMFLPLFGGLMGYIFGWMSKKFLGKNIPSFMVYAMMGGCLDGLRLYVTNCLRIGGLVSYHYLLYGILPRFLWSMIFAILVYSPVKIFQKALNSK